MINYADASTSVTTMLCIYHNDISTASSIWATTHWLLSSRSLTVTEPLNKYYWHCSGGFNTWTIRQDRTLRLLVMQHIVYVITAGGFWLNLNQDSTLSSAVNYYSSGLTASSSGDHRGTVQLWAHRAAEMCQVVVITLKGFKHGPNKKASNNNDRKKKKKPLSLFFLFLSLARQILSAASTLHSLSCEEATLSER